MVDRKGSVPNPSTSREVSGMSDGYIVKNGKENLSFPGLDAWRQARAAEVAQRRVWAAEVNAIVSRDRGHSNFDPSKERGGMKK